MEEAGMERRLLHEGVKGGGLNFYSHSEHSPKHATISQLQVAGVDEGLNMAVVGHEDKDLHRSYSHAFTSAHQAVAKLPSVPPEN